MADHHSCCGGHVSVCVQYAHISLTESPVHVICSLLFTTAITCPAGSLMCDKLSQQLPSIIHTHNLSVM